MIMTVRIMDDLFLAQTSLKRAFKCDVNYQH
jgi:hypothetical protein